MYKLVIIGPTAEKFDKRATQIAKNLIRNMINECVDAHNDTVIVSCPSPSDGIELWTNQIAREMNINIQNPTTVMYSLYDIGDEIRVICPTNKIKKNTTWQKLDEKLFTINEI